ncbi:LacI family DNA-binding transcriptional regulator [Sediminivirga luteola]|nr:LacI family DNA-binding transcriptional regulator [Sediminivirga luteola]
MSAAVPPRPRQRRPTMQDIADRVGVSRQLVSIVLRDADGASDSTRRRVLDAARELGYHPDESARLLRRSRSGQLGVLFTMRQPFEVDLVDALYEQAGRLGYRLVLSTMGRTRSQEVALGELMRQRIEGLIVLAAEAGAGTIAGLPAGIPTVLLGGLEASPARGEPYDRIRVDNAAGIAQAVGHLVGLGHRRIAYIGPDEGPNAAERLAGYQDAMDRHGRTGDAEVVPSPLTEEGGYAAAQRLLARTDRPTAVVCVNDRCAFGVLETFVRGGLRVPEDVSVIGFDDSTVARLPFVDLTSVHPDPERMAALAVEAVHRRIEAAEDAAAGPSGGAAEGPMPDESRDGGSVRAVAGHAPGPPGHLVPAHLVVRGSTGPPRRGPEQ